MPSYRAAGLETVGQSVYIATAAYESVKAGYALSLAKTVSELTRHHIPHTINIMFNNCHVDDGRNEMVRDFLENTQCTDLVFIDADMMWEPDAFLKLIQHKTSDVVAGAYRYKSNSGEFPVGRLVEGGIKSAKHRKALLSVSYAPTGFMRIPRSVFETLSPNYYEVGTLNQSRRFFERCYTDHSYDGGDVTFCRKWIAAGGKIHIDPTLTLGHIGENMWRGNFSEYLANPDNAVNHTTGSGDPVPMYKEDFGDVLKIFLKTEKPNIADFYRLANAYGNKPWACRPEFLFSAWQMAMSLDEDATILECGTGLSTIILASTGRKVIAIEESGKWAEECDAIMTEHSLEADIRVAPMNGSWYNVGEALDGIEADMMVVDGPRRSGSISDDHLVSPVGLEVRNVDRLWMLRKDNLGRGIVKPGAIAILDDIRDMQGPGQWETIKNGPRPFVIGRLGA
jgi:hypothetical protein